MQPKTLLETADVRARIMTLAPGEKTAPHHHSEVTDHIVCLSGGVNISFEDPPQQLTLNPGDYCLIDVMRPHQVANASQTTIAQYLLLQGVGRYDFIVEEP